MRRTSILLIILYFIYIGTTVATAQSSIKQDNRQLNAVYGNIRFTLGQKFSPGGHLAFVFEFINSIGFSLDLKGGVLYNKNKPDDYRCEPFSFSTCEKQSYYGFDLNFRKYSFSSSRKTKYGFNIGPSLEIFQFLEYKKLKAGEYEVSYKHVTAPGLNLKGDIIFVPGRFYGFGIGLNVNLNLKQSYVLLELGHSIGKVKSKVVKKE